MQINSINSVSKKATPNFKAKFSALDMKSAIKHIDSSTNSVAERLQVLDFIKTNNAYMAKLGDRDTRLKFIPPLKWNQVGCYRVTNDLLPNVSVNLVDLHKCQKGGKYDFKGPEGILFDMSTIFVENLVQEAEKILYKKAATVYHQNCDDLLHSLQTRLTPERYKHWKDISHSVKMAEKYKNHPFNISV